MGNIDLFIFVISSCLILMGYSFQCLTILKNKSSRGISFNAYLITFIASVMLTLIAKNDYVFYLGILETLLVVISMLIILHYKDYDLVEKKGVIFSIALVGSFFMLHGIMQMIKSFNHHDVTSISLRSYLSFITLDALIIYLAEDIKIIIALSVCIVIYTYICSDAIYKNLKYKKRKLW